jgi:hypothetical protein
MRKQLFAAALSLVAAFISPAASVSQESVPPDRTLAELTAEVPGHTGITFFDLVKQVIPDLARDDTGAAGHPTVTLRHIAGEGFGGTIPGPVKIGLLRALSFKSEGKPRIAVLIGVGNIDDLAEQPAILAVFDEEGRRPSLLDAVDVGLDRETAFALPALVRIGERDDTIMTTSQHFNARENYAWTALIFLRGGKLGLIDKFLAYSARTCALQGTQAFSFKAASGAGNTPYSPIRVTMTDVGAPSQEQCDDGTVPVPYVRTATAVYHWDPGKALFVADSDAVRRLQEQTAEP